MFDRFKSNHPEAVTDGRMAGGRFSRDGDTHAGAYDGATATTTDVAPAHTTSTTEPPSYAPPPTGAAVATPPTTPGLTRADYRDVRARQRDEFGGAKWGAAFFGWLVAFGVAVLLTGLLSAAGAVSGLTTDAAAESVDETVTLIGGILLVLAALVAYYAGGYVAGRMSRFDGARQGLSVWVIGLLVTAALAAVAVIAGSEYNVITSGNLPTLAVGDSEATSGGLIAMAVMLFGTLLAAMAGGKAGERFHKRIDRVGITD